MGRWPMLVTDGSTTVPIRDIADYPASGPLKIGSQVLSYTAKSADDGQGTSVNGPRWPAIDRPTANPWCCAVWKCSTRTWLPKVGLKYRATSPAA